MKGPVRDVDAQRARWATYRLRQGLVEEAADGFARGGLGGLVEDLDARLLVLPADPHADLVPLDDETLGWLSQRRDSPYGGAVVEWGHRTRATTTALVAYDQYRDDSGWDRYLALHRHGGVEFGSGRLAYQLREMHVFALRVIVGLAWSALAIQAEAIDRWPLEHPFELTVALRGTKGATLGNFAEGWAEPGQGLHDVSTCIEEHILLRWELDAQVEMSRVAAELGDRIEQAFGTTHRRHLAHRGPYEAQFDPRF
jgi:hypothetical protein